MARIYIDAWCVKSDASGMGRYGRGLVPAIVAAAPQHELIILRPASQRGRAPLVASTMRSAREVFVHRPTADWATLFARPLLEPIFRRHGRADLYHSLFHLLPIGLRQGHFAPRCTIISLHDLIWLERDPRAERQRLGAEWLKRFGGVAIPHALRAADHVICGSDATSRRAATWVSSDRRTTVYYGIEEHWFHAPESDEASPPYIAAFGVAKAYKNIRCLVRALPLVRLRRPDVRLMLIGGDGGAGDEIRSSGLSNHVSVSRRLVDDDLRALISGARVFVVPSLIEGFGLPALEAMALGTPLVVSDIDALREVTADAALRFDPTDARQLAEAILRLLDDDALRRGVVARGRARAAKFTWERTAAGTLAVYESVLAEKGTGVVSSPVRRSP
ncbi:MAG TPA: glycosyltransferase family 1 protein [Vicinamibacterales bacterium]|nr:glycosyltransferase family 1 protein [Vicinamibacterales bacterium]